MSGTNFLSSIPGPRELDKIIPDPDPLRIIEANGHIHTPYSFSAFDNILQVFEMAAAEKIRVLGINDFYVTDGYGVFHDCCTSAGIFPLFNIEFIGLMKEEQKKGIRINDPNNPGRIYFCGKGLDYPFHLSRENKAILDKVRLETQNQLRAMVERLNILIASANPYLSLDFDDIRKRYAKDLVRERHLAKALRILAEESYFNPGEQLSFIEAVYGNRSSKAGTGNPAALENEIRSNLLKAGGAAFVEENENSFLGIDTLTGIIKDAGGIPCYPVLLDDPSGMCTEFENDPGKLDDTLTSMGVGCIELIPGRNDHDSLEAFAGYFDSRDYVVTFGTEHNTPELAPLAITARGGKQLSDKLKRINTRGVCVIAAHQYLRAKGEAGYADLNGSQRKEARREFELTGRRLLEYYLKNS